MYLWRCLIVLKGEENVYWDYNYNLNLIYFIDAYIFWENRYSVFKVSKKD